MISGYFSQEFFDISQVFYAFPRQKNTGRLLKKFSSDLILSTTGHTFPAYRGSAKCTDD